mgnify:CR=1 FL=1
MSGYFLDGVAGDTPTEAQGLSLIPASFGEGLSAQFGQSLAENPATRLARFAARNLGRKIAGPDGGPEPELSVEELNAQFSVPGRLAWTEPATARVAQDIYEHHRASAVREDTVARSRIGLPTRFVAGLGATLLDPLNVASAFIPFFGEARIAAALGSAAVRGTAGRIGVRAIEGAGQGLAGAAALEPLNYFLAQRDMDDYTMADSLVNLAFGAAAGGVLHSAVGFMRDRRQMPGWAPESHEAALRQAVAAVAEGRPVQAFAAMEFTAANAARRQIADYVQAATRTAQQAEDALTTAATRDGAVDAARTRLAALTSQMDEVRAEIAEAAARGYVRDLDDVSRARLDAVLNELSSVIPRARRAELIAERDMLLEGRSIDGQDVTDLDAARTEAEVAGLQAAQGRLARNAALATGALRQAEARAAAANRTLSAAETALASRDDLVLELTERTLRRLAGRLGAALSPDEAATMAGAILRAGPDGADAATAKALADITSRAPAGPYLPSDITINPGATVMARAEAALAQREEAARLTLAENQRGADPATDAANRAATMRAETAPKVEGTVADELAEAQKSVQELEGALKAADKQIADEATAAGRDAPEPDPEIKAANELAQEGEALGRAYDAAAACAIRRV